MKKVKQNSKLITLKKLSKSVKQNAQTGKKSVKSSKFSYKTRAGDGIRTHDVLLGKQAFCH